MQDLKVLNDLVNEVLAEIVRQDEKHGPFSGHSELGETRLALACLEDEIKEALDAWRVDRRWEGWPHVRAEVLQIAAAAIRAMRDVFPAGLSVEEDPEAKEEMDKPTPEASSGLSGLSFGGRLSL